MSKDLSTFEKDIQGLEIPEGRILFLHVRLKALKQSTGASYNECARFILDMFQYFKPITMLVPSFTYSFTKSGVYHRLFSKSETGRFSEEVRLNFSRYRTYDPLFSVLDVTDHLENVDTIDYNNAFDSNCIWEYLHNKDAIIVNFDIDTMVATQVHYIEKENNVPYRYDKELKGVIYRDDNVHKEVVYKFFARDLEKNLLLDWKKIERYLADKGVLYAGSVNGIKCAWFSAKELMHCLSAAIQDDAYFLTS